MRCLSSLSLALIVLMALACTASDAEIEATVEARVAQERGVEVVANSAEEFHRVRKACYMNSAERSYLSLDYIHMPAQALLEFSSQDQAILRSYNVASLSQIGQRVAVEKFCRFKRMEPIINFFAQQDGPTAFRSFIDNPPTKLTLNEELDSILMALALERSLSGSPGKRFSEVFATPEQAVYAAMQPCFAENNFRGQTVHMVSERIIGTIGNLQDYQSQDEVVDLMKQARKMCNNPE